MEPLKPYEHLLIPQNLKINVEDIHVDKEEILRAIGNGDPAMNDYVNGLLDDLLAKCKSIASPKATYSFFENPLINAKNGTLEIENTIFNTGKIVASSMAKSSFITFFICTIGEGMENFSKKLMGEGSSLEGFITDIIASVFAEEVANYVHLLVEKTASELNFKITNRYSPGYCNWPVNEQQKLFALMGNNTSGVKLTDSSLMVPIKSVSGIIGLGTDVKRLAYKCNICADEKCILRKIS